ncbi:HNH/endonuclease VII fold putative polymorphic toxin [Kitasatospora sp. YST-16]|uniref:RHS repeat-associated core domain-containing protein n=1 Tax=Kitasatospora sp. YST-16 TaxID=2998080 RepID=UPI0022853553|nr:RHS repeat-associated core domain-containing protein [Kitasatospora sp. YST-16]WAL73012.1 HNH/endonuclease VII fold putative polymorphic toxin [Kitasatospora sp. YST-16]WNW39063.1 RHS repeat-associated core domain-containing protein [Streptomyces sp. Li-HN-5-13]
MVADPGGDALLMRYSYTDGHLSAAYNSSGKPMRFTNDATGRLTSWTDRNDSQYRYTYDAHDRVTDEGGTTGALRFTFTYGDPDSDTGLRTHTETNALGHTTTYTVNDHAQITAVTDPLGHTTRYERDDHDRLLAETDPLGRTTRYAYDGAGDLIAITRPDGGRSTARYADIPGLPVTITEPGGATWHQTYDENGLRTARTGPLGATTTYTYDEHGHLASSTDALDNTTRVRCNPAGLPVEVTDPTGATIRYDRDAFGRVVAITDPLGGTVRSHWTVEGNLAERARPDGSVERWTYDGEGNVVAHTDQLGLTTAFEYTHFETLAARTTPDGARVTFTHDADMRLTTVTDGLGRTWHYDYDAAGRVIGERDYQGRTLTYRLDAAGQVTAVTDPLGTVTEYFYDLIGHLVRKNAGGRETTYAYDGSGHLVRAENADATVTRTVDALGNLLEETVNGRTLRITRDVLGRRTSRTTPTGHFGIWTYDGAGRATALNTPDGSIAFDYDQAGRETHRTFYRRLVLTSEWDSRHRMTGQSARTADRTLQQRTYAYRTDSSLAAVDDLLGGPRTFDLDPVGRVTAVRGAEWEESYAYDTAGNITRASWPATATTRSAAGERTYSGTRISTSGRTAFEYDAAGRTTVRRVARSSRNPDVWHYAWDAEDRLTEVTTPDGSRRQYRYDPFGRRIAKERTAAPDSAGERTDFTWDGPVLAEQTTSAPYLPGPHTLSWEHHGIRPLTQTEAISTAERVDRRFFAIVTDLIGTPTELIDPAAESIAWRATSSLWGHTTWPSDSTTYTPLRFPGQYFDPETRLHYNLHRYYNPETARYLTPDPLGLIPGPNPDAYVANPHTWCDPLGLSPHQNHQGPPRGEHSNPFDSREEAERAAFDLAGVPYGEEPIAEWKVVGDKRYKNMPGHVYSNDPTHWGNFRQFETENGSRVVVEHTDDPAGLHFHAGKPKHDDTRELVNFGWDNSPEGYTKMERYGKMNKPGGDHHFFYRRK